MYESLAEQAAVGMYLVQDDRFIYVNNCLARMLGYQRDQLLGLSLFDVVPHDERQRVAVKLRQALVREQDIRYERKARCQDGSLIDVEILGSRIESDGKQLIAGVMLDVTRRKQEEAMAQLTSLVYQHSSEAMVVTDANGIVVTVNPAFTDITGYSLDEVVGRRISMLSSGRHDTAFYKAMWKAIRRTGCWEGEIWNRRKNGEEYAERLSVSTSYNDDGSVRCRVGLFSDVTEKKRRDERIWYQAHYDYLTGLPNRLMLQQGLEAKMLYARHTGSTFVLLYLDLDLFKEINDSLGHAKGDDMLRQVASRLLGCVRRSDLVARLGGDEFCIVADGIRDEDEIRSLCEKIVRAVAEPLCWAKTAVSYRSASALHRIHATATASMSSSTMPTWPCTRPRTWGAIATAYMRRACAATSACAASWRATFRGRWMRVSSFCITSPLSICAAGAASRQRRCCAGSIRATACSAPCISCTRPRRPALSSKSATGSSMRLPANWRNGVRGSRSFK